MGAAHEDSAQEGQTKVSLSKNDSISYLHIGTRSPITFP